MQLERVEEASVEYLTHSRTQKVSAGEFEAASASPFRKLRPCLFSINKKKISDSTGDREVNSAVQHSKNESPKLRNCFAISEEEEAISAYEVLLEDYPENIDVVVWDLHASSINAGMMKKVCLSLSRRQIVVAVRDTLRRATAVLNEILADLAGIGTGIGKTHPD